MKILKAVLAGIGLIALGFAIYWFVNGWVQLDRMITAVHVTNPGMDSPRPEYNLAVVVACLAGLLIGLAAGLPGQFAGRARRQRRRDADELLASHGSDDVRAPKASVRDDLDKPVQER